MDIKDYLIGSVEDAHRMLGIAMQDLTDEVALWQPPGTANTIASLLAHMVIGEDRAINRMIKGGESLFESGGWPERTGIPAGQGAIWETGWSLNLPAFKQYQEAVQVTATTYLEGAVAADFDREVPAFGTTMRPVAGILRGIIIHHILGHTGEISALKGVQGLKGLPF